MEDEYEQMRRQYEELQRQLQNVVSQSNLDGAVVDEILGTRIDIEAAYI